MVAPLVAAAGISAAASIFSGITGGKGAKKAAQIAAQSAEKDRQLAAQIYNTNVGLATPWADRGAAAGTQINALLGLGGDTAAANDALASWRNSTSYQTGLQEGQRAVNTAYAGRGVLESGAAQKALAKYSADYANGNFGQYLNALQGQQAVGQNALAGAMGAGNVYQGAVSQANSNQASAQANAALYAAQAQQNALAGLAQNAASYFGQQDFSKRFGSSYGTPPINPNPFGR